MRFHLLTAVVLVIIAGVFTPWVIAAWRDNTAQGLMMTAVAGLALVFIYVVWETLQRKRN
jgi:hypothetical protein